MVVSRHLWNKVDKTPLRLWLLWLSVAVVGLGFSLGCAESVDGASTAGRGFWVATDTESTLESPASSTPAPSGNSVIGRESTKGAGADGSSSLRLALRASNNRKAHEILALLLRNGADESTSIVGSARSRRDAGAESGTKDKEQADTTSTIVPSLEAPIEPGNGEKPLQTPGSAAPLGDGRQLEELRRKAMERLKIVSPGKSGEKHLGRELTRLGFDIGQAARDNLRNLKQPSPPSSPTIGNKVRMKVPCRRQPDQVLRTILGQAYNARYMAFIKPGTPRSREIFDQVPSAADAFVGDQPAADDPEALPFSVDSGYRQVLEGQVVIHHTDTGARPSNVHFSRSRRETGLESVDGVSDSDTVASDNTTVAANETAKSPGELLLEKAKDKFKNVKRTKENSDLWTCKYELRWTDLGQDHYPRYLREAICIHKKCWFGQFECRPKAFTVKVLKRWSDSCEITNDQYLSYVAAKSSGASYDFSMIQHDHGNFATEGIDYNVPPELQEKWVWEEIGVNFCCECTNIYA